MSLSQQQWAIASHQTIATSFIQICFVVGDLDVAMRRYSALFGAGPWFVGSGFPPEHDPTTYRGASVPLQARIALGYAKDMMLELVCPMPNSRSIFTEWVDRYGYDSLHHYGFGIEDYDAAIATLEANDIELLMTSRTPRGTRVVMTDECGELNALKEYIELLPATRKFYDFMRAEAAHWDGRSLVFDGVLPQFS